MSARIRRAIERWGMEKETIGGITRTRGEWCEIKGLSLVVAYRRVNGYKWDFTRALETPVNNPRTGSFGDNASPAAIEATRRANRFFDTEYPDLRKRRR